MSNSNLVSWAKPEIGGGIKSAPLGTLLPTDAISELDAEFKNLGYVSEDGLTNADERESDDVKAWGGDTVLTLYTSRSDSFTYTLIENTNLDVLKEVYGASNVEGDLKTGIKIKANSKPLEAHSIVIDMMLKNGVLKRIVIPNASVSGVGEITYTDEDAVGYETTLKANPDTDGNTHYEYIISSGEKND